MIINILLEHKASPNVITHQGQTALSIAQRLGYISVVETLKVVTETVVTTSTTTVTEEKYKVVAPETMHETFMSDSEDEAGELQQLLSSPLALHFRRIFPLLACRFAVCRVSLSFLSSLKLFPQRL